MKRFFALMLCALLILPVAACGKKPPAPEEQTSGTPESESGTAEEEYPYYDGHDFTGETFTILNYESYCDTNLAFAPTEYVGGDILNNAMIRRTSYMEEKLHIRVEEDRKGYADLGGWGGQARLGQLVAQADLGGDAIWDVANLFLNWSASLITTGCLLDLREVDGLHLDEDYWDANIMDALTLDGKCYTGSSKFTLMPFDLTWGIFFNESRIASMGLESPYALVDSKSWTLDKMLEYVKAGAALNGSGSTDFENDSSTVCGIAAHTDAVTALVIAAGNPLLVRNSDGEIQSNISTERLYDSIRRVEQIFSKSQGHSNLGVSLPNDKSKPYGYTEMFKSGRALFLTAEIKDASTLRDMEEKFGVLPTPMYDKEQGSYQAILGAPALLTLPRRQKNLAHTALVLDALSYESEDVMNTYVTRIVMRRNLPNPDSERMMNIIHDNLTVEFGSFFEFTAHYINELRLSIRAESTDPASLAEREADTIDLRVEKFFEKLQSAKE